MNPDISSDITTPRSRSAYRQANLVFRLRGVWSYWRKDSSWTAVPRTGFRRAIEAKTDWPLTDDRRKPNIDAQAPMGAEDAEHGGAGATRGADRAQGG